MLRIQGVEMSHETHLVIFVIQFRKEAGTPLTRLLSWLTQNLMRAAPSKNQQQVPLAAWHRANGPLGKAESYSNNSLLVGALSSCTSISSSAANSQPPGFQHHLGAALCTNTYLLSPCLKLSRH